MREMATGDEDAQSQLYNSDPGCRKAVPMIELLKGETEMLERLDYLSTAVASGLQEENVHKKRKRHLTNAHRVARDAIEAQIKKLERIAVLATLETYQSQEIIDDMRTTVNSWQMSHLSKLRREEPILAMNLDQRDPERESLINYTGARLLRNRIVDPNELLHMDTVSDQEKNTYEVSVAIEAASAMKRKIKSNEGIWDVEPDQITNPDFPDSPRIRTLQELEREWIHDPLSPIVLMQKMDHSTNLLDRRIESLPMNNGLVIAHINRSNSIFDASNHMVIVDDEEEAKPPGKSVEKSVEKPLGRPPGKTIVTIPSIKKAPNNERDEEARALASEGTSSGRIRSTISRKRKLKDPDWKVFKYQRAMPHNWCIFCECCHKIDAPHKRGRFPKLE